MSTMVRAPSEVKVGKTIEIAADWARPSVLPPEPSLSLSLSSCCGLGWALGPFSSLSLSLTRTRTHTHTHTHAHTRAPSPSPSPSLNINLNLTLISHFDSVRVSYGHIRIRSPSVLTVSWVVCTAFLPPHCYSSVKETPQAKHNATISSYDLIVSVSFRDFETDPTLP